MAMTFFEAAIQILDDAAQPLTTREITDRAVQLKLIPLTGETPHASMSAALYGRLGDDPRLLKLDEPGNGRAKRGSVRWTLRND